MRPRPAQPPFCCGLVRRSLHVVVCGALQVVEAQFDKAAGLWTVTSAAGTKVQGRLLVIADGATSK